MKTLTTFAMVSLAAVSIKAATVDNVIVRQQWPWSTDIKVEYRLSDVTSPVDLTVRAFDGTSEYDAAKVRSGITGEIYGIDESVGSFTIDPVKAFGTAKKTIEKLKVKIELAPSAANIKEVIYKVVDIESKPATITDITRADLLNGKYGTYETDYSVFSCFSNTRQYLDPGYVKVTYKSSLPDVLVWTGVTNGDLYRTSKIALRKIPAAGKSYMMGTGYTDGNKIACSFTKDFWIGVFPITQYQLHKFLPNYTCYMSNTTYAAHALRAADGVSYNAIRSYSGVEWPKGNHSNVGSGSYIKLLQTATGNARFDLPTEAQWEFAARAGCNDIFPHGGSIVHDQYAYCYFGGLFKTYKDTTNINRNSDDNLYGAYTVGLFAPNAWGLYDVMGNVFQICLDRADASYSGRGGVDARGTTKEETRGGNWCRIARGGSYASHKDDVGYCYGQAEWWKSEGYGFRICLHEED